MSVKTIELRQVKSELSEKYSYLVLLLLLSSTIFKKMMKNRGLNTNNMKEEELSMQNANGHRNAARSPTFTMGAPTGFFF
jgi:hypothetical protein